MWVHSRPWHVVALLKTQLTGTRLLCLGMNRPIVPLFHIRNTSLFLKWHKQRNRCHTLWTWKPNLALLFFRIMYTCLLKDKTCLRWGDLELRAITFIRDLNCPCLASSFVNTSFLMNQWQCLVECTLNKCSAFKHSIYFFNAVQKDHYSTVHPGGRFNTAMSNKLTLKF